MLHEHAVAFVDHGRFLCCMCLAGPHATRQKWLLLFVKHWTATLRFDRLILLDLSSENAMFLEVQELLINLI